MNAFQTIGIATNRQNTARILSGNAFVHTAHHTHHHTTTSHRKHSAVAVF